MSVIPPEKDISDMAFHGPDQITGKANDLAKAKSEAKEFQGRKVYELKIGEDVAYAALTDTEARSIESEGEGVIDTMQVVDHTFKKNKGLLGKLRSGISSSFSKPSSLESPSPSPLTRPGTPIAMSESPETIELADSIDKMVFDEAETLKFDDCIKEFLDSAILGNQTKKENLASFATALHLAAGGTDKQKIFEEKLPEGKLNFHAVSDSKAKAYAKTNKDHKDVTKDLPMKLVNLQEVSDDDMPVGSLGTHPVQNELEATAWSDVAKIQGQSRERSDSLSGSPKTRTRQGSSFLRFTGRTIS